MKKYARSRIASHSFTDYFDSNLDKTMTRYSKSLLTLMALLGVFDVQASQPLRRVRTFTTENAEKVEVWKVGNAEHSWYETADGQCWNLNTQTKRLASGTRISERSAEKAYSASGNDGLGSLGTSGLGVVSSIGLCRIPVIMVAYADLDFQKDNDRDKLSRFLNEEGYNDEQLAKGSVADYFHTCSYGLFQPQFDVVAKVTLSQGYKYYGEHQGSLNDAHVTDLVREAVDLAIKQGVDFKAYASDGKAPIVSIIHAGPGEHEDYGDDCDDYVWAHFRPMTVSAGDVDFASYIINNETLRFFKDNVVTEEFLTGIGTFCHEFGHALGLPDMYDTNGEVDGKANTPGYWDIMDYQFMYDGYRPTTYSAYERSMLGWLQITTLTTDGEYVLSPLDDNVSDGEVQAFRIQNPQNPSEYFIFENRRKSNFYAASYLGEGMLAWHVDYYPARWNQNTVNTQSDFQCVQVIPADGQWQSVKDLNLTDENGIRYTYTGDIFPGYEDVTTFNGLIAKFHKDSFKDVLSNITVLDDGRVSFRFSSTTGVNNLFENTAKDHSIFGIDGRKLPEIPQKGLYILDGNLWYSK